jgi:ATP-dependent DNA helicase RecG
MVELDLLQSFRKILELEQSKGFQNNAVIGGLDLYLQRWSPEIARALENTALQIELTHTSYGTEAVPARQRSVKRWLKLLQAERMAPGINLPPQDMPPENGKNSILRGQAITNSQESALKLLGPSLDAPITILRGVNTKIASRLKRLKVETVRELLYCFPKRHDDFSRVSRIADVSAGEDHTVIGTVWEARPTVRGPRRIKTTEIVVSDDTGNIRVVFFGRPYLTRQLRTDSRIVISGKVEAYRGQLTFQSPEYEILGQNEELIHTARMVPVYPLTHGLVSRTMRRILWEALESWLPAIQENLPDQTINRINLMPLRQAVMEVHYPKDTTTLESARRRLAFEELLVLQLAVLFRRRTWQQGDKGVAIKIDAPAVGRLLSSLPFSLTDAQRRCLSEIGSDMERGTPPMNRMLQGEVGSGKTIVALAALLAVVSAEHQGVIMAPTEILAEQHFNTIYQLFSKLCVPVQQEGIFSVQIDKLPHPVTVGLLVGSTHPALKKELRKRLADGTLDIAIGTHALIQDSVQIARQALAVVDEQHRFGVAQRSTLRQMGSLNPHVLVMSATPIPRSLALTLYGDLDISTIDQLPPGRQKILTRWVSPDRRRAAYGFVRKEVASGRQAFVVCPLIEETEAVEARAAAVEYERLSKEEFPDLRLGLLHGRMRPSVKEDVMHRFRDGDLDILVSTPVVEVGIDVPNASVMLIEGADRFGLAQLHQFRGRVGRGAHKSYCILLADDPSGHASERLSALESIHDGFKLAEVDLTLRGPGDFFGTRQSGLPSLRMARLSDQDLLRMARDEAATILNIDPTLKRTEHAPISAQVSRFLQEATVEAS